MTQKQKAHRTPHPPKARRLPAPKIPPELRPLPPRLSILPPDDNPHVNQIVRLIEQMAIMSGLSPYVLLRDWLGMLESGLKMWPANMRAMALEGQFIEDPPEIQAIFSQVRERYLRVSEQRPAVYRQMQEAFSEAFALLLDSSTPGLEQIKGNPDVCLSGRPEIPGGQGTCALAVNMIPRVLNATPGLHTMADLPVPAAILGDVRDLLGKK